jgi:hypothetical protein
MFQRYNISSATDQLDALKKTAAYLAEQPTKRDGVVEMRAPEEAAS